jgi:hypothetical protein
LLVAASSASGGCIGCGRSRDGTRARATTRARRRGRPGRREGARKARRGREGAKGAGRNATCCNHTQQLCAKFDTSLLHTHIFSRGCPPGAQAWRVSPHRGVYRGAQAGCHGLPTRTLGTDATSPSRIVQRRLSPATLPPRSIVAPLCEGDRRRNFLPFRPLHPARSPHGPQSSRRQRPC